MKNGSLVADNKTDGDSARVLNDAFQGKTVDPQVV